MDYLDMMNGTARQTFKGEYYARITAVLGVDQTPEDWESESPIPFFYEEVDTSRGYQQPVNNVIDRQAESKTIRTKSDAFYGKQLEGFVRLQNGSFYQIESVAVDIRGVSRQAAVYTPIPVGSDYILILVKIDNPFKVYGNRAGTTVVMNLPEE